MRLDKDQRHKELEDQFNQHRTDTQDIIDGHTSTINDLTSLKLHHESKILGHENTIHQKKDVEDHHASSK